MSSVTKFVHLLRLLSVVGIALSLSACVASGPATQYYGLFADPGIQSTGDPVWRDALGVGPIVLPEFLEKPSIVTLTASQQIRVSGYHAWAGKLQDAVARVLADNIAAQLNADNVWAFPWDTRVRPDYQLRVEFEELAGIRGEDLRLSAKWTLFKRSENKVLYLGREQITVASDDDSYDAYVAALNQALNQASVSIAKQLEQQATLF